MQRNLKIITWNVNGIRASMEKGLREFLQIESPDIYCLQETKSHPELLSPKHRQHESYELFWSSASRRGYSGVVTATKLAPQKVEYGIGIRKFDQEGRFVITEFPDFLLYNVYFPNGGASQERHEFKQEFLLRFLRHLKRRLDQGKQVIVVGDYNVAYLDIDVFDPKKLATSSGFLPEEREWFENFLQTGFIDSFRYFYPDRAETYSWWSMRENARLNNNGWRIDHICVSSGLRARLRRCEIFSDQLGSDHCPVMLELTSTTC